jgi:endonuclease/exonuclease/phosphatase (EEP) superfamily protein YafD
MSLRSKRLRSTLAVLAGLGGSFLIMLLLQTLKKDDLTYYARFFFYATAVIGMVAAAFKWDRLVLMLLSVAIGLGFFLKNEQTSNITENRSKFQIPFAVLHANLSSAPNPGALLRPIYQKQPDLLTFQELTPDWLQLLQDSLKESFPYQVQTGGLDPYSMLIMSRYPLIQTDTLSQFNSRSLFALVITPTFDTIPIVSSYFVLPDNIATNPTNEAQASAVTRQINNQHQPGLLIGDLNHGLKDDLMQRIVRLGMLSDSRPQSPVQNKTDYILFQSPIKCTEWTDLGGGKNGHLGIFGRYAIPVSGNMN